MNPRVIIVEDESVLRTSMMRAISRLPDLVVEGAGTAADAVRLFDSGPVDLLISDIDLPDRLGIELLGELRRRHPSARIVFVSAYLKAYQSQIPPSAHVQVFEKPLGLDQLRDIVQQAVGGTMSEAAAPFGLADYIQLAALGRHSVRILVKAASGSGEILILSGDAWGASDDQGIGMPAFVRLCALESAQVTCTAQSQPLGERNLEGRVESLLLEAARLRDEGATEVSNPFEQLRENAMNALMSKDYPKALSLFEEAQGLVTDDRLVNANIQRLRLLTRVSS